ncbi:MAG: M1 family metallopeptidase, partial [Bacteroidota bacterium]
CQGLGASVWWPCKDHMYDEPDSMLISVEVPANLMNVSNGRLQKTERNRKKKTKTYHWYVDSPIANYGVNINIGDYVHYGEKYAGEKGALDVDYYVLRENLTKAKKQFEEVPRMLKAFEHWFGPYPFYEDGYKLVEAPYLGMEHQSSVTYGNKYQNGYLGRDLSTTGWGLKFDFIIVHESGHEWFANNITYADIADMWVHESFTNYSESLFVEYFFGKDAGQEYVRGTRLNIRNDQPIIGTYNVNQRGSGDMYYKGGNMLNMIRQLIADDEQWRKILRGLNEEFYHQVVTTQQIEQYMIAESGIDLSKVFDQYLRETDIPVLDYWFKDDELNFRWSNCVTGFDMPVDVIIAGKHVRLSPTQMWQKTKLDEAGNLTVNPNYYVASMKLR